MDIETHAENKVQEQIIDLSVLTIAGHCYTVSAMASWTVREVKDEITCETLFAQHQQRLLLGTRVLSDADILVELLPSGQMHHELLLVICSDDSKVDVIAAVVTGQTRLRNVDEKYHEDAEVVHAAVKRDGMQLEYARGAARKDRSIILSAIEQNGFALNFAPASFATEREVVLTAVKSSSFAFTLADDSLQTDVLFAIEAVRVNSFVRDHLDHCVLADARFAKKAFAKLSQVPAFEDSATNATTTAKPRKSFCGLPLCAWCRMPARWTRMP